MAAMIKGSETIHSPRIALVSQLPSWVRVTLLFGAFAMPWSGDLDLAAARFLSLAFNVCMIVLVLYWIFCRSERFSGQPIVLGVLGAFLLLHTLIVYGVVMPDEFRWTSRLTDFGFVVSERVSTAVAAARLAVYFGFAYALGAVTRDSRLLAEIGALLGASILLLFMLGGTGSSVGPMERFTGGYGNPNAFAEVCLLAVFLNLGALLGSDLSRLGRVMALVFVAVGFGELIMTASRSALLATFVGLTGVVFWSTARHRIMLFAAMIVLVFGILAAMPDGVGELLRMRIAESVVNLRALIWRSYLEQWRDYALVGVGLGRELTVLDAPIFQNKIWPPHNTFLRMTVEFGVVGLFLLVLLCGSYLRHLARIAEHRVTRRLSAVAFGLVLAWLVLMVSGDRLASRAFWFSLGLAGGIVSSGEAALRALAPSARGDAS
ncbi:MAG: O-antigen ligase family protein [Candidatus Krumholzibacteria bacterium]|nr:O-antigen ligase family protein [Candidatus Krumholzibacteria bacterium]